MEPQSQKIHGVMQMPASDDDREMMARFNDTFRKLKTNREQVPLEVLTTKYATGYKKLVDELTDLADWLARCYFQELAFPTNPADKAGNEWLDRKIESIKVEESQPGGLVEQYRKALIDDLSEEKYQGLVWRIYDRMDREAFDPYQQRYNRWIGPPENRWIYNSLFKAYWLKKPDYDDGGYWIDKEYNFKHMGHPPKIDPDQEEG